jgi:hypothetical protein
MKDDAVLYIPMNRDSSNNNNKEKKRQENLEGNNRGRRRVQCLSIF